jgi:hypothetical protein
LLFARELLGQAVSRLPIARYNGLLTGKELTLGHAAGIRSSKFSPYNCSSPESSVRLIQD